jgi:S-adenosylmethionine synthetase
MCDAIAEAISVALCRHYLTEFGSVLHHNVDKVLLCGGASRPAFGGGEILEPIEIYLAGRATEALKGRRIPVHEIAVEACRAWLKETLVELDVDRHVKIISRIRRGSVDLTSLFEREADTPLANDTSCGVGFAPLTNLERAVLEVERTLNSAAMKQANPSIGTDIKVMGVRKRDRVALTIGCAFVGRHLRDVHDYAQAKDAVARVAQEVARRTARLDAEVVVNVADDVTRGEMFLTVAGTSAEAGDDGEVGRGNRTNGLITPNRAMTLEAAAGKNPVSHVGKLYGLVAGRVAKTLVDRLPGVTDATCSLVSQIGRPITDPQVAEVTLCTSESAISEATRTAVHETIAAELGDIAAVRRDLLEGRIGVY